MTSRISVTLALATLVLMANCASQPSPTPDLVATQVAVLGAAAATLTAEAPTPAVASTPTPAPTATPTPESPDDNERYHDCLFGEVNTARQALLAAMSDMSYENACASIAVWREQAETVKATHLTCVVPTNQHLLNARRYVDSALDGLASSMIRMELNCLAYDPRLLDEANQLLAQSNQYGELANAELESYRRDGIAEEWAADAEAQEDAYWDWQAQEAGDALDDYYRDRYEREQRDYEQSRMDELYDNWQHQQHEP